MTKLKPPPIIGAPRSLCRPAALTSWKPTIFALASDEATIDIFDVIGEDWWGGVSAKQISAALAEAGGADVTIRINSPGGSYYEGAAIYNLLLAHPGRVRAQILGIAGSAASIIALAASEIEVSALGEFFIHNCSSGAYGCAADFERYAAELRQSDEAVRDLYVRRSGQKPEDVTAWMDAETTFSAQRAVALGFCDAVIEAEAELSSESDSVLTAQLTAQAQRKYDLRVAENGLRMQGLSRTAYRGMLKRLSKGAPSAAQAVTPGADEGTAAIHQALTRLKHSLT